MVAKGDLETDTDAYKIKSLFYNFGYKFYDYIVCHENSKISNNQKPTGPYKTQAKKRKWQKDTNTKKKSKSKIFSR